MLLLLLLLHQPGATHRHRLGIQFWLCCTIPSPTDTLSISVSLSLSRDHHTNVASAVLLTTGAIRLESDCRGRTTSRLETLVSQAPTTLRHPAVLLALTKHRVVAVIGWSCCTDIVTLCVCVCLLACSRSFDHATHSRTTSFWPTNEQTIKSHSYAQQTNKNDDDDDDDDKVK